MSARRLPSCDIGDYQGFDDCERNWNTPRSDTAEPVTLASLVHMAKEHAVRQRIAVPAEIARPNAAESMVRSGAKFERVKAPDVANDDELVDYDEWNPTPETAPKAANENSGADLLPLVSTDDLASVASIAWIVHRRIRDGIGLWWGAPKSGKTSLIAGTVIRALHGLDTWGVSTRNVEGWRALYLATEDLDGLKRAVKATYKKLRTALADRRLDIVDLRQAHAPQLTNADDVARLRRTMIAHKQRILIIDVMALAMAGEKMTEADAITRAFQLLLPLFEQDGISIWLVTHSIKTGATFFGAVQLLGSVYFDFEVRRERDQIVVDNHNVRGAAKLEGYLAFNMDTVELPELRDNYGEATHVLVPEYAGIKAPKAERKSADRFDILRDCAMRYLCGMAVPEIGTRALATEAARLAAPELETADPPKFESLRNEFGEYLRNLPPDQALAGCVVRRGGKRERILAFRNPAARGRRAPRLEATE
jgi:AAA domain